MNLTDLAQFATPIGAIVICLYIIWQLLDRFVLSKPLQERVFKLETNHIVHIQADVEEIKASMKDVRTEQINQGNRLTRVETKLETRK